MPVPEGEALLLPAYNFVADVGQHEGGELNIPSEFPQQEPSRGLQRDDGNSAAFGSPGQPKLLPERIFHIGIGYGSADQIRKRLVPVQGTENIELDILVKRALALLLLIVPFLEGPVRCGDQRLTVHRLQQVIDASVYDSRLHIAEILVAADNDRLRIG
ncbi:hypothetical protein D3C71_1586470 [compost metagenome]